MLRALWTSKTGLAAQQDRLDLISNNISNSSTTGYKKMTSGFKDLYSESLDRLGYPINDKSATTGTGVRTTNWFENANQGVLQSTGITTDLAIEGEGNYFRLTNAKGQKVYTRDGSFKVDSAGKLVDSNGNRVDIEYANGKQNTFLDTNNMSINTKGEIYQKNANGAFELIGQINTYTGVGNSAFVSIGDNLYVPAEGATITQGDAKIHQGYLEASNVDLAQEFTDMIVAQRAFQLSSKALQTADELWGDINNMRQ